MKAFPDSSWCDIGMVPSDGLRITVGCDVEALSFPTLDVPHATVWTSKDGGATWEQTELADLATEPANQFVSTAMDEAGNAFHAWIDDDIEDDRPAVLNVARRLTDGDWEVLQPKALNGSMERVWVSAAAGRLAVSFSGREEAVGPGWFPYVLVAEDSRAPALNWTLTQLDPEPQSAGAASPGDFWQNAIGPDGQIHACYGRLAPVPVSVNVNFRNDLLCVHEIRQ